MPHTNLAYVNHVGIKKWKPMAQRKRKNKEEVVFSPHERRVFGIPQKEKQYGAEALALRKMINAIPWIVTVADCGFDDTVKNAHLIAHGMEIQADRLRLDALKDFQKRYREKA